MKYFTFTKESCLYLIKEIKQHQTRFYAPDVSLIEEKAVIKVMAEICSINNSLLHNIRTVKEAILEGKINNHRTYHESDLKMVDVILHIYHQCTQKNTMCWSKNYQKLQQQLDKQLIIFEQALDYFPEDLAINVKQKPTAITNISLDYYQFIYLALSHTYLELQGIKINQSINTMNCSNPIV